MILKNRFYIFCHFHHYTLYIKKAHLDVKRGVEDVVGVPLGGDSDPPTMRAQHPFHFQISCHLKVERKCQLCHLCSFLVWLRSISTFPVSWLVTPPDVNWTPELDLPWRYNCYDLKIIYRILYILYIYLDVQLDEPKVESLAEHIPGCLAQVAICRWRHSLKQDNAMKIISSF